MKGKIIKLTVLITVLLVVLSIWYFTPKQHTETIDGVYYQLGEDEIIEHVKIHFDGKLQNHINGKKSFDGAIAFEGNEVPQVPADKTESGLRLIYHGENFSTIYSTYLMKDDQGGIIPSIYQYGGIYINDDFTEFTIKVFDNNSWSETGGFMITAPANEREEAMKKSKELIRNFEEW